MAPISQRFTNSLRGGGGRRGVGGEQLARRSATWTRARCRRCTHDLENAHGHPGVPARLGERAGGALLLLVPALHRQRHGARPPRAPRCGLRPTFPSRPRGAGWWRYAPEIAWALSPAPHRAATTITPTLSGVSSPARVGASCARRSPARPSAAPWWAMSRMALWVGDLQRLLGDRTSPACATCSGRRRGWWSRPRFPLGLQPQDARPVRSPRARRPCPPSPPPPPR